ncbi:hypothetical protein J1N35_021789 [Gossypium stocksii]|uniref:Uncharacterized protein n=1 Tax=Gossypium stocksii TaxID=47602 RepID=A0A9D4A1N0_9ROSI|nr:hypothetical protein J1N35_021789 [Gossypium stocksii]
MVVQASMLDMSKKRRTNAGSMNVVVSSEEEGYTGRLEQHRKRRTDYAGPFTMMGALLASPFTSLPSIAHVSLLIVIHYSFLPSAPPSIPLSSLPPTEEPLVEVGLNVGSAEASMASLGLSEGIGGAEATKKELEDNFQDTKQALERAQQKQVEVLEKFKEKTLENFNNFLPKLKANVFLHAQVVGSPFDVLRVDLDALYDVNIDQLGFNVCFPSGAG